MTTLEITKRDTKDDLKALRANGVLPAVFYGKSEDSTPISLNKKDFKKVYEEAGESTIVVLKDGSQEHNALIHDLDYDPVTDEIRHVDFYIVEKGQKVQVNVPLEFVGESPAVKSLGGTLIKVLHELEVEADPTNLPHSIEVDISAIVDFNTNISVGDLTLPAGVVATADPTETVVSASEAKEEEEPAEGSTEIDMEAIGDAEQKGKGEEAEGEGGE